MTRITWHDAVAFCRWANARLPTEAEWEKAARGTDDRRYPWGNQTPNSALCNFGGGGDTTPVGSYPKGVSPYGCLDMVGNVWEWTSSIHRAYPYDALDGRESLQVPHREREALVLRGGSYSTYATSVRCAVRLPLHPYYHEDGFGFRVVASPSHS